MLKFQYLAEGNLHKVYSYIGDDPKLKGKVFRIKKQNVMSKLSRMLVNHFGKSKWTNIQKYFLPKEQINYEGVEGEIMDNLHENSDITIELKPKTYLPILSESYNLYDDNYTNMRFFKVQLQKVANKLAKNGISLFKTSKEDIHKFMSKYDPRKFYSTEKEDIYQAIMQMQEVPENNFRIRTKLKLEPNEIAELISQSIIQEDIIQQLLVFFESLKQLGVVIEKAKRSVQLIRDLNEQQINNIHQLDEEKKTAMFIISQFMAFQSLSDISIMVRFRLEGEGKFVEVNNQKYFFDYHIVDCDLKPIEKFDDYYETIEELEMLTQYYKSL